MDSQSQSYSCPESRFQGLINSTRDWLTDEGFRSQKLQTEDGGTLIQIERTGGWRKFVGMSTALNIVFRQVENMVNVEIGAGRWIDKVAAGAVSAVSMLILWPLAVTAGIGAWRQANMPGRIFGHIAEYLSQPE